MITLPTKQEQNKDHRGFVGVVVFMTLVKRLVTRLCSRELSAQS
jgi:hypothetical protein